MVAPHELAPKDRVHRACDHCYQRKIKCDAVSPRCNDCAHKNISCTYNRLPRKRVPRLASAQRGKVDRGVTQLLEKAPSQEPHKVSRLVFPFLQHVGNIRLCGGAELFPTEGQEWVENLTGEKIPTELCSNSSRPWEQSAIVSTGDPTRSGHLLTMPLPDRTRMNQAISAYFNSLECQIWPLLDATLFRETERVAYEDHHQSPLRVHTARICVWAAWAFISAFPGISSHLLPSDRAEIMTSVMASINLLQQPHVELLEAIAMLVTVHLLSGNVQAGAVGNTLAAQYVLRIGGNTRDCFIKASTFASTGDERFRINFHLRNLFWICYQQDKELCLRSGQPPTLSEDNSDLDLPVGYEQNWNISLGIDNSTAPVFPGDLRLSQIKSKAHIELYSQRALEKNGALVLSAIRQLDDDLEKWRMSIPADYRPTMLFNEKTPHRPRHLNIRSLMLRLEYYHCVAYIHQACARFQSMTGSLDQEIQGVTSSLTFSMAACRSSLYYLVAVQDTLVPKDFWLTLFYTLSAILTVFCFLISNPGTPEARNDLEIIRKIAAQLRRLGQGDHLTEEPSQTEPVWKVITTLEGLAERTIEKQIA